jgi:hypothetical protein
MKIEEKVYLHQKEVVLRDGGVAQVEYLPSKHEALSSKSNTAKINR